ncbi:phosphatase [Lachnospiraceae bacterium OttesenSCG-928-D06]|nr:phosphatase [Lachnospiraceae bacterium OttesenSCG-928-D06]
MKLYADLHTHTNVSQHAYSTIHENVLAAKEKGFVAIGITDHGPEMMDGAIRHHFYCLKGLPETVSGLQLVRGAEVNIKDYQGRLDLDHEVLKSLDLVIASYHVEAITPASVSDHSRGWLNVIQNPDVDCLGHIGNPIYSCDYEAIVKACSSYGKAIEINSNSFKVRPGSDDNCKKVAELCMHYCVPVLVNSDAHILYQVGEQQDALNMLASIGFPEELIINADKERVLKYIERLRKH